jgi:hypothetical protein
MAVFSAGRVVFVREGDSERQQTHGYASGAE